MSASVASKLERDEYIEQAYFYRTFRERLVDNVPAQEILSRLHQEVLTTTRLPLAIQFLHGEYVHTGLISAAMQKLGHYFTPFQAYVMRCAERDSSRFHMLTGLEILSGEAAYRGTDPVPAGLFFFQFECLCRHRLGYLDGLHAMAGDPGYDAEWQGWIRHISRQLGDFELAEVVYLHSRQYVVDQRRLLRDTQFEAKHVQLFSEREGRIAWASRGRDPLYFFSAVQRHLGYPGVPKVNDADGVDSQIKKLQLQLQLLDKRVQIAEQELRGQLDLSQFYVKPEGAPPKWES